MFPSWPLHAHISTFVPAILAKIEKRVYLVSILTGESCPSGEMKVLKEILVLCLEKDTCAL